MIYVEELVGPDTVNTMPRATVEAVLDHGEIRDSLDEDVEGARKVLDGPRGGRDRLRRRRGHAREGGREEVRRLLQGAVRGHRVQARPARGRVMAGKGSDFRRELGQQLRVDSIRCSAAAGSGHPTSSMSAADLMAVLLDGHLRLDYQNPGNPANDHLVFSKGHASPLYYSILKAAGVDRRRGVPHVPQARLAAGGPPHAADPADRRGDGLARPGAADRRRHRDGGAHLDKLPYRVWCLCGDSEMAEGSMWEAFQHAGWEGLDNIVAIIDVNRLGQTRETMLGWDTAGVRAADRGLRLERDRDRRPRRRRRSRPPTPRPSPPRASRPRSSPAPRRARASRPSRTCPASTASRSTTRTRRSRSSAATAT